MIFQDTLDCIVSSSQCVQEQDSVDVIYGEQVFDQLHQHLDAILYLALNKRINMSNKLFYTFTYSTYTCI